MYLYIQLMCEVVECDGLVLTAWSWLESMRMRKGWPRKGDFSIVTYQTNDEKSKATAGSTWEIYQVGTL